MLGCASGCGQSTLGPVPNQPPTLTLTSGPIDTSATNPVSWAVAITWDARDPDGVVDHVQYALDPPTAARASAGAETTWVRTTANTIVARFRAATPDPHAPGNAIDFHVFAARAWDNSGASSELVVRAFYASTVAPSARIVRPEPAPLRVTPVPRTVTIWFDGEDPDGLGSLAPTGYRVRLVSEQDPLFRAVIMDPDSLRREAVASQWRGWSTLPGDQTSFELGNLPDDTEWIFAVAAEDAAGAITPLYSFANNLLRLFISDRSGPILRMLGPGLDFTYSDGSASADPSRWLTCSVPSVSSPDFRWSATAAPGRSITGYRWVLDPDTLESETPRSDELLDTSHWSEWSQGTTGTGPLGPLPAGDHMLYVQARDDLESRSLGIVKITTYLAAFDRPLLIVDDTRFELDRLAPGGCLAPYARIWPSATELDTLLVAVGGVPWRCATNPSGALSPPGLFAGYRADTVSTRVGVDPMVRLVTLELLARYRAIVWLTDQDAAYDPGSANSPLTMLRWMSRPFNSNPLAEYSRLGGRVWLAGGGTALATLVEADVSSNNTASNAVFKGSELVSRSVVVGQAHLRSQVNAVRVFPQVTRSTAARGDWGGHGADLQLAAPDYARLPATLTLRTSATEPLPPTRAPSQAGSFYPSSVAMEYAHGSEVFEDFGGAGAPRVESALDTLFDVIGATIERAPAPAMFYYHGRENGPVIFSGFDLWSWSRSDTQALVDFVLSDVWGMSRSAPAMGAGRLGSPAAGALRNAPLRSSRPERLKPGAARRTPP